MTTTHSSVRVVITGHVQGVGYRAWTADVARGLKLAGWVRNRRDGSVEAVFAGPAEAVEAMVADCRIGPRSAGVSDVTVSNANEAPGAGFEVRPTA
jgi:acylphosphatase